MTKKVRVEKLPMFDMAEYLDNDVAVAEYLSQVLTDGGHGELANALGHIAKARGMAQIAKDAGIGRESLYKALRADANPRFDTISRVCKALGVKLVAQPVNAPKPKPTPTLAQLRGIAKGADPNDYRERGVLR